MRRGFRNFFRRTAGRKWKSILVLVISFALLFSGCDELVNGSEKKSNSKSTTAQVQTTSVNETSREAEKTSKSSSEADTSEPADTSAPKSESTTTLDETQEEAPETTEEITEEVTEAATEENPDETKEDPEETETDTTPEASDEPDVPIVVAPIEPEAEDEPVPEPESTPEPEQTPELETEAPDTDSEGGYYIVNINSGKFHYPNCASVDKMKEKNKRERYCSRDELISEGYVPCKNCSP